MKIWNAWSCGLFTYPMFPEEDIPEKIGTHCKTCAYCSKESGSLNRVADGEEMKTYSCSVCGKFVHFLLVEVQAKPDGNVVLSKKPQIVIQEPDTEKADTTSMEGNEIYWADKYDCIAVRLEAA